MPRYIWTDGMCRVSLAMTMDQAMSCSGQGQQLDNARALASQLKQQLDELDETKIIAVLREAGFDQEALDDGDNLARLVWLAACDIRETPQQFRV